MSYLAETSCYFLFKKYKMLIEKLNMVESSKSFNTFAFNKTTHKCGKIYYM